MGTTESAILTCSSCFPIVERYARTIPREKGIPIKKGWMLTPANTLIYLHTSKRHTTTVTRTLRHRTLHNLFTCLQDCLHTTDLIYLVLDYMGDVLPVSCAKVRIRPYRYLPPERKTWVRV